MRHSGQPRVVITGIGVVSPFGVGRERFWDHVQPRLQRHARDHRVRRVRRSPAGSRRRSTGVTIDDVPPLEGDDIWDPDYRADPKRYSRAALIGVIAAREAWSDAGLRIGEPGAGVIIGSGGGGIDVGERQYHDFFVERGRKVTPYAIPVSIVGMMSSEISISLRLRGVSHVLSCGCTSSTDAIGYAAALDPRRARPTSLLSGGADACVTPGMIFGFSRMKVVSTAYNDAPGGGVAAVRPRARRVRAGRGRVDGRARARGSRAGARRARSTRRSTATGRRATRTTACRWRRTARRSSARSTLAIERSGRPREEIGYVNYHGTSTVLNDAVESRCVRAGVRRSRRAAARARR